MFIVLYCVWNVCSMSERLKVSLPQTDFTIDAAHEVDLHQHIGTFWWYLERIMRFHSYWRDHNRKSCSVWSVQWTWYVHELFTLSTVNTIHSVVCFVIWYLYWIVQCFTSPPTHYRLYGRRFLQVKRPNQQYQSTKGSYKGKQHKEQRKHKIHMHRHTKNRQIQHTSITQQVP